MTDSDPPPSDAGFRADQAIVMQQIAEGVYGLEALFESDGRLVWISPSVTSLTNRSPRDFMVSDDPLALLVSVPDLRFCRERLHLLAEQGATDDFEIRLARADDEMCWVSSHWRCIGGGETPRRLRMSAENIQVRKQTEYELLETVSELRRSRALSELYLARSNDERTRLIALLNVIRLGILFLDEDRRVLYYNRAMLDIWGFAPDENLIGMRDAVLHARIASRLHDPEAYMARIEERRTAEVGDEPVEIGFLDGRIVTEVSAIVEDSDAHRGIGRVRIYEDVTEARRTAAQLVHLAERDPLTDLFNRRRFHEELDRLLADAMRRNYQFGLVTFDLDGFKPINDLYGHQAGDEVLVEIARHVGGVIRRNETFFRLGGDEFAVLVADADRTSLDELARRIVEGVASLEFTFVGKKVGLTASAGIGVFPMDAADAEDLVAAADRAMYRSKAEGRNRWTFAVSDAESDRIPDSGKTNRNKD